MQNFLEKENIEFSLNEPLSKHISFKLGGNADVFVVPKNPQEIKKTISHCLSENIPYYILGQGTNTVFCDSGFKGTVIKIGKNLEEISLEGDTITVGAGTHLSSLCKFALDNELAGLEFAYGIPGNVGGAIYMNAGAYGGEIKDNIKDVTVICENGEVKILSGDELQLGYRTSRFHHEKECIISASFKLLKGDKADIKAKMDKYINSRKEKQPLDMPSAGSTFKRPVGAFAGALIEECGLRGFTVGGAQVSEKHCGFVVNKGNATCEDVINLTDEIIKIVKEKTGYTLEKEIRIIR